MQLLDDKFRELEHYKSGVFAIYQYEDGDRVYDPILERELDARFLHGKLGICFRGANEGVLARGVPFDRSYGTKTPHPQLRDGKNSLRLNGIVSLCDRTMVDDEEVLSRYYRNAFVPLEVSPPQLGVMRELLSLCNLVEKLIAAQATDETDGNCDILRTRLNLQYDEFLEQRGTLAQHKSYWENFWVDIRLGTRLASLEGENGGKADIFYRRTTRPRIDPQGQMFFDGSDEERVRSAFAWCNGYHGRVCLEQIAEKAGVPVAMVEELVRPELALREAGSLR